MWAVIGLGPVLCRSSQIKQERIFEGSEESKNTQHRTFESDEENQGRLNEEKPNQYQDINGQGRAAQIPKDIGRDGVYGLGITLGVVAGFRTDQRVERI